jgi:hypothetical protein
MRGIAIVAGLFAAGCASHSDLAPVEPMASQDWRCTLRIAQNEIFVDGHRMSRADAIARCKAAAGGAVVVLEDCPARTWDQTTHAMVVNEDKVTKAEWDETRSALQREGVRIYVRGPLCYDPRPLGCRPTTPAPELRPSVVRHLVEAKEPLPPAPSPRL